MDTSLKKEDLKESCKRLVDKEKQELEIKIKENMQEQIILEIQEYTEKQEAAYQKKCEKIEKDFYKQIYSYELDGKKKIIDTIKNQNQELIKEIEKCISQMLDTPQYEEFFENTLKETLKRVNVENDIVIGLVNKDYNKYSKKIESSYGIKCKIIEDKFIGGLILENKNVIIDNTLKNAIEEKVNKKN